MIIVKLKGGLGNQMFQYAFGINLAKSNGTKLMLDVSNYGKPSEIRNLALNDFKVEYEVLPEKLVRTFNKHKHPIINKVINIFFRRTHIYVERKVSPFNPNIFSKNCGFFDGYWQSEKYFRNIREEIIAHFRPKELKDSDNELIKLLRGGNFVSIHVRRTDYLNNKNAQIYVECSLEYYINALAYVKAICPDIKVVVFSDDYEWVKQNLKIGPYLDMSEHKNQAYLDIYLMSLCKHNIIANSTFSWWGAWLNQNENKVVIAPEFFFRDENKFKNDIIPTSWIRIAN